MKPLIAWLKSCFCLRKGYLLHDWEYKENMIGIGNGYPTFRCTWDECKNCKRQKNAVNYNLGVQEDD